ncbi:MAG: hypothetical protein ACE5R4_14440 [Armatimonadota bacterium]
MKAKGEKGGKRVKTWPMQWVEDHVIEMPLEEWFEQNAHLTQGQMAVKLGVSVQALRRWQRKLGFRRRVSVRVKTELVRVKPKKESKR